MFNIKFCRWLDSNLGPTVLEATLCSANWATTTSPTKQFFADILNWINTYEPTNKTHRKGHSEFLSKVYRYCLDVECFGKSSSSTSFHSEQFPYFNSKHWLSRFRLFSFSLSITHTHSTALHCSRLNMCSTFQFNV